MIYYAGHGNLDIDSDEGYWLPVDAEPDNQARVILKYLWANDNDRQRVGRGEATVRSIGGQFEVTEFKSLHPTPIQLLRADAGASGI